MKTLFRSILFLFLTATLSSSALDQAVNFGKVVVSTGYTSGATSVVVSAGQGAKLPQTPPYNLVWWDATHYNDPSDDPNVEIVRVTNIATDTLTIVRAQESTLATNKNNANSIYKMDRTLTAKELNVDIPALVGTPDMSAAINILAGAHGGTNNGFMQFSGPASSLKTYTLPNASVSIVTAPTAGVISIAGPTAPRTWTGPDANMTLARTDAGQTFTGVQVMTSPSLLGTVSIADPTTPAISLASGGTNTGSITINGKTSGSFILKPVDATGQNLTLSVAAQTSGAATVSIPDMAGTSRTVVTAPSSGPISFTGTTAARVVTVPDAAFTVARSDAGQTFTGVQIMTSPSLLGTVSIADATTPAISLASGKTNTGSITVNGKTSGSLIITAADATAQAVTLTVAAQTTGAATLTIPDQGGTSRTFVTSPSAGPISFTGSTASRVKTVRDAADTVLELGGSYTPTGTWTSLTMVTPVLGTPTSGNLSNCTSYPIASVSNLGTNVATMLTTFSSANIASACSDEEGSGAIAFCAPIALTSVPTNTGGWNEFKVSGSDFTTTGQTLVDITGLVTGTISTNSRYEFHAVLYCTTTAVTTGCEYGVHVSQAPTQISALYIGPTTVSSNLQTMTVSGTNADNIASAAFLTTASEDGVISIDGFFTTGAGASPAFSIRTLKVTSGTSTVKIGSRMWIKKL